MAEICRDLRQRSGVLAAPPLNDVNGLHELDSMLCSKRLTFDHSTQAFNGLLSSPIHSAFTVGHDPTVEGTPAEGAGVVELVGGEGSAVDDGLAQWIAARPRGVAQKAAA